MTRINSEAAPKTILLVNKFLYQKGGDATYTLALGRLLESQGHRVVYWGMAHPENPPYAHARHFVDQVDYGEPSSIFKKARLAAGILYSWEAKRKLARLLDEVRPDVAHLQNFAHQLTPSIVEELDRRGIPTMMTMHDYKLVCASYTMQHRGQVCEACRGGRYYSAALKGCMKQSRAKSLLASIEMYLHHRILRLYDPIRLFIAPSRFMKEKIIEMGFTGRVEALSNFVDCGGCSPRAHARERSVVYFGRLSEEKGLFTLLEAMKGMPEIVLKLIGDGPLSEPLRRRAQGMGLSNVKFLGRKTGQELAEEVGRSWFAVLPSEVYENCPYSILEAFALGKPVVGAGIGGIPELVEEGKTGMLFRPGNAQDLEARLKELLNDESAVLRMGAEARRRVERDHGPERHYMRLAQFYSEISTGRAEEE